MYRFRAIVVAMVLVVMVLFLGCQLATASPRRAGLYTKSVTGDGNVVYKGSWIQVTVGGSTFNIVLRTLPPTTTCTNQETRVPCSNRASLWVYQADYGAKGDGQTNDTSAIQSALEAAAKAGGGTVVFPNQQAANGGGSRYLSSAITVLSSNTAIEIQAGATMVVSNNRAMWPGSLNVINSQSGLHDVALVGAGTIDGQGQVWWANRNDFRPKMLNWDHMTNVLVSGLTIQNSPNHNLEVLECHLLLVPQLSESMLTLPPPPPEHRCIQTMLK